MSGNELDLDDPKLLASLLNIALSENEDTADDLVAVLEQQANHSDDGDDDDKGAELEPPPGDPGDGLDDAPVGLGVAGFGRGGGGDGGSLDDTAGIGPDDADLSDLANSLRGSGDPWTDIERRRARGRHISYRLHATHSRSQPIESKFTGECQSVRVSLPQRKPDPDGYIGTYFGRVEVSDHLLFSIDEVCAAYELRHGTPPTIERVDLITGARFMGRRFSPVSCYLAYARADQLEAPSFYILEGGSAQGKPKALYVARDLSTQLHEESAFQFTPLSCSHNWYTGGLRLEPDGQPKTVYLSSAQERDGSHGYFSLEVSFAVEQRQKRVILPFSLQVEAAMRVLAISEQAGCDLGLGRGGGMQPVLGPMAEGALDWDIRPRGRATIIERNRFCGCP